MINSSPREGRLQAILTWLVAPLPPAWALLLLQAPLAVAAALLAVGIALADRLASWPASFWQGAVLAALSALFFVYRSRRQNSSPSFASPSWRQTTSLLLLAVLLVAGGGARLAAARGAAEARSRQLEQLAPGLGEPLLAVVCGAPQATGAGWRLVLCPWWSTEVREGPRLRLEWRSVSDPSPPTNSGPPAQYGDLVAVNTPVQTLQPPRSSDEFDARRYWEARRLPYVAFARTPEDFRVYGPYEFGLLRSLLLWRQGAYTALQNTLPTETWGLAAALLFGDQGDLAAGQKEQFQLTGLAHLLAVSGLHVGLLAGFLKGALRPILPGRGTRYIFLLPALGAMVLWTGGRPPVVRAALMLSLAGVQTVFRRPPAPLNSWGAAVLVLLLYHPWQLWDVGFQLSFTAALGMGLLIPGWLGPGRDVSWRRRLTLPFAAGGAAFLASAPVMAGAFNSLQPLSIALTPLAVPFVTVGLVVGLASTPLITVFPGLTPWLAAGLRWPLNLLQRLAALAAAWPLKPLVLPPPQGWTTAVYYVLLAYCFADGRPPLVRQRRPRPLGTARWVLALVGLAALLAWHYWLAYRGPIPWDGRV